MSQTKDKDCSKVLEPVKRYRPKRILLIYNPKAGAAKPELANLEDIVRLLQQYAFEPEIFLVDPGKDLAQAITAALKNGVNFFVACGGDGTCSATARLLAGTGATFGIIPLGTQNNSAFALEIPQDPAQAIRNLREGRKLKVDVGQLRINAKITPFIELCSIGLVSELFPSADDFQHGNIFQAGEFIRTLAAEQPSEFEIYLDTRKKPIKGMAHVVLVANMPVIGLHYRLGKRSGMQDGKLELMFFENASKLDLLKYVFQGMQEGLPKDTRIKHILAHRLSIKARPEMAVMIDDRDCGKGDVELSVLKHALTVMIPKTSRVRQSE